MGALARLARKIRTAHTAMRSLRIKHLVKPVTACILFFTVCHSLLADTVTLSPGLNLVGIPIKSSDTPDTFSLIQKLGTQDTISKLNRLNPASGIFESARFDASGNPQGLNVPIQPGEGWLVFAKTVSTINVAPQSTCPTINLQPGLNIVGFPCAPKFPQAYGLLQAIGSDTVVSAIQTFDLESGRFLTVTYDQNGAPAGQNFQIQRYQAYLVHMVQSASPELYLPPQPVIADAGPFRNVLINTVVTLDGSASRGSLTSYLWGFLSKPGGSGSVIENINSVSTGFTSDLPGIYNIKLTVSDGVETSTDEIQITAIDPTVGPDKDDDGLSDDAELILATDPDNADSDFDGLSDGEEYLTHLTDPLNRDTDGDGFNDGNEIAAESNPFNVESTPIQNITVITNVSPQNGETMVSINRETIVQFNRPIDPVTLTDDAFYLIANGQRINGRTVVSSSRGVVTFYYDAPLTGSTAVRIIINGEQLLDENGRKIDANGDNYPGGVGTFDFITVPLTRIPGTSVSGFIYDANRVDEQGNNIPISGAVLRVEGITELQAVTDATGFFILEDLPAPEFYVSIDATGSPAPAGAQYGSIRKAFHSIAGHATVLVDGNGRFFDVFLPLIHQVDTIPVVADQVTMVTFGPQGLDTLAQIQPDIPASVWQQLQVVIPPNSVFHDDGTPATQVTVVPLPAERIPVPIPEGLNPSIVFTVDAGGATNVDGYAQLIYPNVHNLPPGEKRLVWSFDHDAGKWITTGTVTVSADGAVMVSDPGSGVKTLGWRLIALDPWTRMLLGCSLKAISAAGKAVAGCANGVAKQVAELVSDVDTGLGLLANIATQNSDVGNSLNQANNGNGIANKVNNLVSTKNDFKSRYDLLKKVWGVAGSTAKKLNPVLRGACTGLSCAGGIVGGLKDICGANLNGTQCFTDATSSFCQGVDTASFGIEKANNLKKIAGIGATTGESMCTAIDELNKLVQLWSGGQQPFPYSQASSLVNSINNEIPIVDQATNTTRDFMQSFMDLNGQVTDLDALARDLLIKHLVPPHAFYAVFFTDLDNFAIRGITGADGDLSALIPANTAFVLVIFDPASARIATAVGVSNRAGQLTLVPIMTFDLTDALPDLDGDGLADQAELVIGTDVSNPDTDGDGLTDASEVKQGLDPLDDRGFPTGIIGQLSLMGEPQEITIAGSSLFPEKQTAYIATGSHGLAIADVSQFNNPVLLGQIALGGNATDIAIDSNLGLAFLPIGNRQVRVVNIIDPQMPTVKQTISSSDNANAVEVSGGFLYVGGNFLSQYEIITGQRFKVMDLGAAIVDLTKEATRLYVITQDNKLHVVETANQSMALLGSLALPGDAHRMFAANNIVYIANGIDSIQNPLARGGYVTVDVTDPTNPQLISDIDTPAVQSGNLKTVANGSGLALVAGGFRGLQIHRAPDAGTTYDLLTEISLPGRGISVAIAAGIAYAIDDAGYLNVVNYLSFDSNGVPPTISITSSATSENVAEGSVINISANVTDDVQVRSVEFFIDGNRFGTDLSFPFNQEFVVPPLSQQTSVTITASVVDTGGNTAQADPLILTIVPDTMAPRVIRTTPFDRGFRANVDAIGVYFSEAMNASTINFSAFSLLEAGSDGVLNTPDDISVDISSFTYNEAQRAAFSHFSQPLPAGQYSATLSDRVTDVAGNAVLAPFDWSFTVFELENDTDADCVPDSIEILLGLDPTKPDTDGDTIPDGDVDSDGDGIINCEEVLSGFDPGNPDSDGDFLQDGEELFLGTNPLSPDSDNDGFSDKDEIDFNFDPLNGSVTPLDSLDLFTAVGGPIFTVLNATDPVINASITLAAGARFTVMNSTPPPIGGLGGYTLNNAVAPQIVVLNTIDPPIAGVEGYTLNYSANVEFSVLNSVEPPIGGADGYTLGLSVGAEFSILNNAGPPIGGINGYVLDYGIAPTFSINRLQ